MTVTSSNPETIVLDAGYRSDSATHSQLSGDDRLFTGVTPGYVRLSVGIEPVEDLIADLTKALDAAQTSA